LRLLTLGELADNRRIVSTLLAENETLFAEHKSDIAKGEGYQLAKAAASFANTLGGWILIGVRDGNPISNWNPPPGAFVDAVRQRLEGQIDPLPSFAAGVFPHGEDQIGVVRIYESTDTPHILIADGSVVVREPAQDSKLRKRGQYEATPIRSHYELSQLAQRGQQAQNAAEARLAQGRLPLIERSMRFHWTQAASNRGVFETVAGETPALILRAVPLNLSGRWKEWAVSDAAVDVATRLASQVIDGEVEVDSPTPDPGGVAVTARGCQSARWIPEGHRFMTPVATAAIDAGGAIGLRLGFEIQDGNGLVNDWRRLDEAAGPKGLIGPLLADLVAALADAEHLGRFGVHLIWLGMGELFRVEPDNRGEGSPPPYLPGGGSLTVDGSADTTELDRLAQRWSEELMRGAGVSIWRSSDGKALA
jgi:hypothetical protein